MAVDIYKKVAEKLDAMPTGFPATENGVEIRLLQKIFPDSVDAANWLLINVKPEPIAVIAKRFGKSVAEVQAIVDGLVGKGLIKATGIEGTYYYFVMPFVIGMYEDNYLHGLVDKEYAEYFEEYLPHYSKSYDGFIPEEVRVIPVSGSVDADNVVYPYDDARKIVEAGKSFKLLPCVCRFQRNEIGEPCPQHHSIELGCIVVSYDASEDENSKYFPPMAKSASKEEALAHLEKAAEAGLIHQSYNLESNNHFICNCCTCCCGLLRGALEFKATHMMLKSNYLARIDADLCTLCGVCADERCQFDAIVVGEQFYSVNPELCAGCGVCVSTCPVEAIVLEAKPESEQTTPFKSLDEFYKERSLARTKQG